MTDKGNLFTMTYFTDEIAAFFYSYKYFSSVICAESLLFTERSSFEKYEACVNSLPKPIVNSNDTV